MKALVVTGVRGEGGVSEQRMIKDLEDQGYEVEVVPYYQYRWGMGMNKDVVLGHSMGGMVIQADPTVEESKIHTFQAPIQDRGTHHSTYGDWLNLMRIPRGSITFGDHSYQSGQWNG